MSTSRSSKIEQLSKVLKKHYKPLASVAERSVIEHLVYACVVEESGYESADEAVAKLQQTFVDFNEIRVTTAVELAELFRIGSAGVACAQRLKRILQSVYETRYSFDLEDLKKGNLAKSVEYLSGLKGMTPFVCSYINQNALGGHAIPLGSVEMELAFIVGLVTEAEAKKGGIPGLERAIPKSKGLEFAQLIHQFAMDFRKSWKNATVTSVFKEMKVTYKPAPPPAPVKQPAPVTEVTAKPTEKAADKTADKDSAKGAKAGAKEVASTPAPVEKPTKDAKSAKNVKQPAVAAKEQKPDKEPAKKDVATTAAAKPTKEAAKADAKPTKSATQAKPTASAKKEPQAPPKTSKKSVSPPPAKAVKSAKNTKPVKPATKPATKSKSVAPPPKQKPPTVKKPTPSTSSKKPTPKTSSKASQSKATQALTKKKPR